MKSKIIRVDIEDYKRIKAEQLRLKRLGIIVTQSKALKAMLNRLSGD